MGVDDLSSARIDCEDQSQVKKCICFVTICLIIGEIISTTILTAHESDELVVNKLFSCWIWKNDYNYNNTIYNNKSFLTMNNSKNMNDATRVIPKMLINIGIRSSGTSELANRFVEHLVPQSGLCTRYDGIHECLEYHYWDKIDNCGNVLLNNYNNKTSFVTARLLINQSINIQFDLFNDSSYYSYNYKDVKRFHMKSFCNPIDYISGWAKDYKRNISINKSFSQSNQEFIELLSNNYILFEKSPRYYLYPHISFIFANSVTLSQSKIVLFLRDPIKAFLSGFYDAITIEASKKRDENNKNKNNKDKIHNLNKFVNESMKINLMNKLIWNNIELLRIVRNDLLLPYVVNRKRNDQFKQELILQSNDELINLDEIYDKVIHVWKNTFYYQYLANPKNTNLNIRFDDKKHKKSHKFYVVRSCHIMLLLSWFKDFGYFRYFNNINNKNLRNRLKIIQAEYYFSNEEIVFNYLINWVLESQNKNKNERFSIEKQEPIHSQKLRPNIDQDEIYKISQFYYPCTAHTIHFLQTNQFRNQLIFGPFDPTLWTLALKPAGKPAIKIYNI